MTRNYDKDLSSRSQDEMVFFEWFCDHPVIFWNSGIMLVKDLEHRFIASNTIFSDFSGFSPKNIVGLSDEDMPWANSKDIYIGHENDIISGLDYSVIEPLDGIVKANLITKKSLIYNKRGLPSGTIANAVVFNGVIEYGNLAGTAVKMKVSDFSGYNLTASETKVLYFILKGFSRSKVAELALVSTSSYDFHVRNIKEKFGASTIDDVVFTCYKLGFHELIPYQAII